MRSRDGFVAAEAIVALLLLLAVLQLCWTVADGVGRAAVVLADRAEALAAARTAAWVLQEEVNGASAGRDVIRPGADSLALRAFRGAALACGGAAPTGVVVRYQGLRAPDPGKDSVLVLGRDGTWTAHRLRERAPLAGGCGTEGKGVGERWRLDPDPGAAVFLRVFERGSYHIADGALRYRAGGGGRQPLTPAALDPAASRFQALAPGVLAVHLGARGPRRGGSARGWTRTFGLAESW
jgi:hypothetical protein